MEKSFIDFLKQPHASISHIYIYKNIKILLLLLQKSISSAKTAKKKVLRKINLKKFNKIFAKNFKNLLKNISFIVKFMIISHKIEAFKMQKMFVCSSIKTCKSLKRKLQKLTVAPVTPDPGKHPSQLYVFDYPLVGCKMQDKVHGIIYTYVKI